MEDKNKNVIIALILIVVATSFLPWFASALLITAKSSGMTEWLFRSLSPSFIWLALMLSVLRYTSWDRKYRWLIYLAPIAFSNFLFGLFFFGTFSLSP